MEGLEEARCAQQTAISALNDLTRVVHSYKVKLLQRSTKDLKALERVIHTAIREMVPAQHEAAPSPHLLALLAMTPAEQRSKLHFATVMQAPSNATALAVTKSINLFISKQLSVLPVPQEPVKFLPLLEQTKVYLSPTPFTLSYEVHIAELNPLAFYSAWGFLSNGNVLATGTSNTRLTLSIDFALEYAVPLADTLDVHWVPGITIVDEKVYLFGGLKGGNSPVCEVLDLYENEWALLPDMLTPRSHFQPSLHLHFIYIFGGLDTDRAERFDITRYCFEPLNLVVPSRHWIVTYCDEDTFYLFTRTELHKWDQRGPLRKLKEGLSVGFFSQMQPLRVGQEIYFFARNGEDRYLMKFQLQTYKLDIALQFGAEAN